MNGKLVLLCQQTFLNGFLKHKIPISILSLSHLYLLELLLLRYRDIDTDCLLPSCVNFSSSQEKHVPQDLTDICSGF